MTGADQDIILRDETTTQRIARSIGALLHSGDCLLLQGSIGAGKTTFARALIQSLLSFPEDVPSPTFTLVQTYMGRTGEIWHCDLYRLGHPDEVLELGLDQAFTDAITLIEWPDRLGDLAPKNALNLTFFAGPDGHHLSVRGPQEWMDRLEDLDA